MNQKLAIVIGTRPEIIKLSSVIRAAQKKRIPFFIIHTGQHYSPELDRVFFKDLALPTPKYNLHAGKGNEGFQMGDMLSGIQAILSKEKPSVVIVQGDTNSVFAGAYSARRLQIPVAHVEAGLRSYDERMPEETNRVLTDHMSAFLFPPTALSRDILRKEGIVSSSIFVTGNTIVDAVNENLKLAKKSSSILKKLKLTKGKYMLATFHRAENVDDKKNLKGIVEGLRRVSKNFNTPIIVSLHPRTLARFKQFKISVPKELVIMKPVGYLDFLSLMGNANLILTDSGGIQEEACVLKIPCVTLRENTERPETVKVGSNILGGTDPQRILRVSKKMVNIKRSWKVPFGEGKAGEKIVAILKKNLGNESR